MLAITEYVIKQRMYELSQSGNIYREYFIPNCSISHNHII